MVSPNFSIETIVEKTPDLPTIPMAAIQVLRETESSECNAKSVAAHLLTDQALSVRVLRLSNSAYYGLSRQINSIQEAVVILGMRAVRNLCMVASTYPWMQKPLKGYGLDPKAMWSHSFGVGVAAQELARASGKADPDFCFTAGLLHNIGKVALSIWLENFLPKMIEHAQENQMSFDAVERKILGYDHADVGAYLAEKWNFPENIVRVVQYHHNPDACPVKDPAVDCIHVADFLTMSMGYGLGGDGLQYDFQAEALARLGISQDQMDAVLDTFVTAYEEYEKMFEEITGK